MERRVADLLNQETTRFYQAQADSFSDTRKAAWPGWERCAGFLEQLGPRVRLFDLACGNARFERFLLGKLPDVNWSFSAVDSCDDLVSLGVEGLSEADFSCQQLDVVSALLDGSDSLGLDCSGLYDVGASFGFFHHVPGLRTRARALRGLVGQVRPGGLAMVSLWQFEKSEQIFAQARGLRPQALADLNLGEEDLEPGDHLLGWKKMPGVYRYCHSFSTGEVNMLLDSVADIAEPLDVFESDGRTGNLNTYLVLRRV